MKSIDNKKFECSQFKAFFFIGAALKETKKSISSFIALVLLIINSKIVFRELLSLANLAKT